MVYPILAGSDMLTVCLDLMKSRMDTINQELSRYFLTNVLFVILDKSPNPKLILCIIRLIEEWLKNGLVHVDFFNEAF